MVCGNSYVRPFMSASTKTVVGFCRIALALALLCVALVASAQSSVRSTMAAVRGAGTLQRALSLESVTVDPAAVLGGESSNGTVTLNQQAPTGGTVVTLTCDNAAATVPASVTVAAGSTSASFTVTTTAVGARTRATVEATLGNRSRRAELEIMSLSVQSVSLSPQNVTGGSSATATVTLNGAAPSGGSVINLSSSSNAASVAATVTIAAGQTTGTFSVATTEVTQQTEAHIKANLGNSTEAATLIISPSVSLSVSLNPLTVTGGMKATGTVTLTGAAPAEGLLVNLASNSASAVVEPNVRVKSGSATANFEIRTFGVSSSTTVTITATIGSASGTATLTVTPPTLASVSLEPATIGGGASTTGIVTLSGPAPEGGVLVNLASSQSAAQVQSSVKVPGGRMSATFAVATTSVTSATTVTITATLGTVSQTASLTINALALNSLTVHPNSINDGKSATGVVELNGPAGTGGVVVTLASDNAAATIPATATIAAGHSSATFVIATGSVTALTTVNLTATLGSTSKTATLTINPVSLVEINLRPDRVTGGSTSTGTVRINGPAPAGGLVVTLASNSSSATVPATVTIPAGQNAVTFTVTTLTVTAKTIVQVTATLGTTSKTENLTITQSP